jgi:hypothetical protein
MSHHLESIAAMLVGSGKLAGEKLKQLLVLSVLTIALTGCGLPASPDVRAYDACIARHAQEVAVCEGPRQAYQLDPTAVQARAPAISPSAGSSYEEPSAAAHPALTPVPLRPNPITTGRNG